MNIITFNSSINSSKNNTAFFKSSKCRNVFEIYKFLHSEKSEMFRNFRLIRMETLLFCNVFKQIYKETIHFESISLINSDTTFY